MDHSTEVFVGIDVAKVRNAVALADGERGGEVRYLGEVDACEESMRRLHDRSGRAAVIHLRFNEAEARPPRMPEPCRRASPSRPGFNEAEARPPRMLCHQGQVTRVPVVLQ